MRIDKITTPPTEKYLNIKISKNFAFPFVFFFPRFGSSKSVYFEEAFDESHFDTASIQCELSRSENREEGKNVPGKESVRGWAET